VKSIRVYKRRSSAELTEEKVQFAHFVASTFEVLPNFRTELRNLLGGNYGESLQRQALRSLQAKFRGSVSGKIVSSLAEAWGVPVLRVIRHFKTLPAAERRELDGVVASVVEEVSPHLTDEIAHANAPAEEWRKFQKKKRACPQPGMPGDCMIFSTR